MGKKSTSVFSDTRLDKAHCDLLEGMTNQYSSVLHQIGKNKNEETRFANFINNDKVTPDLILQHRWSELTADWTSKHILVTSDTSTLTFPKRKDRKDLGWIADNTNKEGFHIHPSVFIDAADGSMQGLGGLKIFKDKFARTKAQKEARRQKQKDRQKYPFEDKQSYKWFASSAQAIKNSPQAARYTLMADRESDIFELMHLTTNNDWDFIYRNRANRLLFEKMQDRKLYEALERWTVEHTYLIEMPATKNRTAHTAKLRVKFGTVSIAKPKSVKRDDMPSSINLQVVQVKECKSTVVKGEKPINWVILTSHPVFSVEQAMQIIKWYQWRWTIEELFRALKTKGLNIESSEIETFHGLSNLTTMALLAAVKTMQLVKARDGNTDQKMEDVFSEKEQNCLVLLNKKLKGNTEKSSNPFPVDSLAFASWVIGRLGGWNGYKKSRPPGPITMTRGLARFYFTLEGFSLLI